MKILNRSSIASHILESMIPFYVSIVKLQMKQEFEMTFISVIHSVVYFCYSFFTQELLITEKKEKEKNKEKNRRKRDKEKT